MNDFALYWQEKHSVSARNKLLEVYRMSYRQYLQTEHWVQFSETAKENSDYTCQNCGAFSIDSSKFSPSSVINNITPFLTQLEVHHTCYFNLGQERLDDVSVLCRTCHEFTHSVIDDFMFSIELLMQD